MKKHNIATAALIALAACTGAWAQSWDYTVVKKGNRSKAAGEVVNATVQLEERDGKAYFRMSGGSNDLCLRGELPATVTRTAETTTIEPLFSMAGCEAFRLVIRNNGSGGEREFKRGDQWVGSNSEHGLKPSK